MEALCARAFTLTVLKTEMRCLGKLFQVKVQNNRFKEFELFVSFSMRPVDRSLAVFLPLTWRSVFNARRDITMYISP